MGQPWSTGCRQEQPGSGGAPRLTCPPHTRGALGWEFWTWPTWASLKASTAIRFLLLPCPPGCHGRLSHALASMSSVGLCFPGWFLICLDCPLLLSLLYCVSLTFESSGLESRGYVHLVLPVSVPQASRSHFYLGDFFHRFYAFCFLSLSHAHPKFAPQAVT